MADASAEATNWLRWAIGIATLAFSAVYGWALTHIAYRIGEQEKRLDKMRTDGAAESRAGDDKLWAALQAMQRDFLEHREAMHKAHLENTQHLGAIPTRDELRTELDRLVKLLDRRNG